MRGHNKGAGGLELYTDPCPIKPAIFIMLTGQADRMQTSKYATEAKTSFRKI